jgi:hypothetical protein
MVPFDDWIPITAPQVPEPMNPPGAGGPPTVPEPMNPPGAGGPPTVPEPMNPPGEGAQPSVPEPMNPPRGFVQPVEGVPVSLIPRVPFDPPTVPLGWSTIPGYKPHINEETGTIVTWPGSVVPVRGTIDPDKSPVHYGHLLADVLERIEDAVDVIQNERIFLTPFSAAPERERSTVIQQEFWVYTAALTKDPYEKEDFAEKVYDQFETSSGTLVATLPKEQKEELDKGVEDFWTTFQATGVQAKIISKDSPSIDGNPNILATVSRPSCRCNDISYDLEVKRGGVVVHSDSYTNRKDPKVAIAKFNYGDVLDVKISNISANCQCNGADCEFYPAESTNPNSPGYTDTDIGKPGQVDIEMENDGSGVIGSKGNNNCQNKDKSWNAAGDEYTFKLETRDENTLERSVFQRLRINSYCQLDDCRRSLCAKIIQLNFARAR